MPTRTRLSMKALFKIAPLAVLLLAGCASVKSNALPPLKEYSKQFQSGMKAELPTVRACCPNTNTFVNDAVTLRKQLRAGKAVQERGGGLFKLFRK